MLLLPFSLSPEDCIFSDIVFLVSVRVCFSDDPSFDRIDNDIHKLSHLYRRWPIPVHPSFEGHLPVLVKVVGRYGYYQDKDK